MLRNSLITALLFSILSFVFGFHPALATTDVTTDSITTTGTLSVGGGGLFQVGDDGDLDRIKDVPYSWPAADGAGALTSDGSGNLSWTAAAAATLQAAYDADTDGGDVTITTNATDGKLIIAGDQDFVYDGSGNVGIGTTVPAQPLDVLVSNSVAGTGKYAVNVLYTDSAVAGSGADNSPTGLNAAVTASGNYSADAYTFPTGGNLYAEYSGTISDTAGSSVVGLYGIGKFSGSITSTGWVETVGGYFYATGDMGTTGDTHHIGVDVATVTGSADENSGITVNGASGATSNYGLKMLGISAATNNYAIYSSAAAQSYISGNVGIGDTSPAGLLTVGDGDLFQVGSDGDLDKIKNVSYSWPTANAAGVLTSDVSGNLSWTAAGTMSLQNAYDASTSPELTLDATRGALTVRDAASPTGMNLFEIQNNGNTTKYLTVSSTATLIDPFATYGTQVGIGTNSFSSTALRLDVQANQDNFAQIRMVNLATTSGAGASLAVRLHSLLSFAQLTARSLGSSNTTLGNIPMSATLVTGTDLTGGLVLNSISKNAPMIFATGGQAFANERMRITEDGRLGIWDSTPTAAHVVISASSTSPTENILSIQDSIDSVRYLTVSSTTTRFATNVEFVSCCGNLGSLSQGGGTSGALSWRGMANFLGNDGASPALRVQRESGAQAANLVEMYTDALTTPALIISGDGNATIARGLSLEKGTGTTVAGAVTINTTTGVITDASDLVLDSTVVTITLTNSRILTSSVMLMSVCSTPDTGAALIVSAAPAAGSAVITVRNAGIGNQTSDYKLCFQVTN